ncbi:MAG: hypothetical protein AB7G13_26860 [Lautropia sp.]
MQRRTLLRIGLFGPLALAAGGALIVAGADAARGRESVLRATAPILLAGALPEAGPARAAAIDATLAAVGRALAGLPADTRRELDQAFALLSTRAGRVATGGPFVDWAAAEPAAIERMLSRWRFHAMAAMQAFYHALHDLTLSSFYADESRWAAIGYPGPLEL